jgi:acyl carrier protein
VSAERLGVLTFEEFVNEILRELDMDDLEGRSERTLLFDDLGLDSLTAYELIYMAEELAGLPPLPEGAGGDAPDFQAIETLGDAYAYYRDACARANRVS